jgi:hypothetical protein
MPTEIKLWHIDDEHPKPIVQDKLRGLINLYR